ncbi:MAG TPA: PAS domain S-box protein [Acidimicrobiales bacterium]|nr:PAS domain S-box protein [Acidimicrobiales bacterium]
MTTEGPWSRIGTALLEREFTLPPDPRSPGQARRILRDVVTSAGDEQWIDTAELALSEVVTNATLHARTQLVVIIVVYDDCICVEVRDGEPALPALRHYDREATTGRGLALVESICMECGVHSLGEAGKSVWFCVGAPAERSADDLLSAWDLDDEDDAAPVATPNVVLRSMPATLWLAARQHHDALLRELVLYAAEHELEVDFAAADHARYAISNTLASALEEAERAGLARPALPDGHPSPLPWVPADLDLELRIRHEDGPAFLVLQDILDTGERLAVEGRLLLHPALPEVVAVRDWACEQVVAQLAGIAPAPWAGTAQERFEVESNRRNTEHPAWDPAVARDSDRGVVAADDANRIVAISRPLADLLGWEVDDLVGRRVVTLIPPSLREAHVAGFSRHLTTGEAHVLDVPVTLPVLHADGSEIQCRFLVQRAFSGPGPSVYLAWIEPLQDDVSAR